MTLVPTTKGKIMTSRYSDDRQGRTQDFVGAAFSGPIFYSDQHARYLLSFGPRYVNVFRLETEWGDRYLTGSAHNARDLADATVQLRRHGHAVYRIVVKPKRVLA